MFTTHHSPLTTHQRRGWALLQMMTGIFVSGLVMGACVPLFLAGQKHADRAILRVRERDQTRELEAHFREDVRQAQSVRVEAGGRQLRLTRTSVATGQAESVEYRATASSLIREARVGGTVRERSTYTIPKASFEEQNRRVRARLTLGRETVVCDATLRSQP